MKEQLQKHTVETNWRETDAAALEERAKAIADWLDHTEDLIKMFGDNGEATQELRSVTGLVKKVRNDISDKAETIRAELAEQAGKP